MKSIDTEVSLSDIKKLKLNEFEEVVANIKKLNEQPSSCKGVGYRHISVHNPGWEFPDGTRHLIYEVRYQTKKEESAPKSLKTEEYSHQEIREL